MPDTITGPTGCRLLATTPAGTEHDIAKLQEKLPAVRSSFPLETPMPVRPPRPPFNVHYNRVPAMLVPVNGMFEFENELFLVLATTLMADDEDDWVHVRPLAKVWTDNPYPRWQFGDYEPQRFRADTIVHELIPLPPQPPTELQQLTNSELRA